MIARTVSMSSIVAGQKKFRSPGGQCTKILSTVIPVNYHLPTLKLKLKLRLRKQLTLTLSGISKLLTLV